MPKTRKRVVSFFLTLALILAGLGGGIGLGLLIGWILAPVEYVDTDLSFLHPQYQDEFMLMVSEAYAIDHDLDTAKARLALLRLDDPATRVADLAEKASSESQILRTRALAQLAADMGIQRDTLVPYLNPVNTPVPEQAQ